MVGLRWPSVGPAVRRKVGDVSQCSEGTPLMKDVKRTFLISVIGTPRHKSLDVFASQLVGSCQPCSKNSCLSVAKCSTISTTRPTHLVPPLARYFQRPQILSISSSTSSQKVPILVSAKPPLLPTKMKRWDPKLQATSRSQSRA
jgi:hypothetical protein